MAEQSAPDKPESDTPRTDGLVLRYESDHSEGAWERLEEDIRQFERELADAKDAYIGLKGCTDALLRDADRRLADWKARAERVIKERDRPAESAIEDIPETAGSWEERCAALYQVIGALSSYAGVFVTEDIEAALDVAAGRGDVEKLLPWPKDNAPFMQLEKLVGDMTVSSTAALDAGFEAWIGRELPRATGYEIDLCRTVWIAAKELLKNAAPQAPSHYDDMSAISEGGSTNRAEPAVAAPESIRAMIASQQEPDEALRQAARAAFPSSSERDIPSEAACKALYWHRGHQVGMGEDELSDLWAEDRDKALADIRAEYAVLTASR